MPAAAKEASHLLPITRREELPARRRKDHEHRHGGEPGRGRKVTIALPAAGQKSEGEELEFRRDTWTTVGVED